MIFHIDNLVNFLVPLLSCKHSDFSIGTLWIVHIVSTKSHANLSVCSVHYFNHILSSFELFTYVFGPCWCHHWGKVFLSEKVFSCIEQLILQSHERAPPVQFFLDQAKVSVVSFFWTLQNLHPSNWNHFRI